MNSSCLWEAHLSQISIILTSHYMVKSSNITRNFTAATINVSVTKAMRYCGKYKQHRDNLDVALPIPERFLYAYVFVLGRQASHNLVYRKVYSIRRTKSQNLNVSRLIL